MNAACPRESSPRKPTTRFREIAIMIYAQTGISSPAAFDERPPENFTASIAPQNAPTRMRDVRYVLAALLSFFCFAICSPHTFTVAFFPRRPEGLTRRTTIRTRNTIASDSCVEI